MTKPINGIDMGYNQLSAQQKISGAKSSSLNNVSKITGQSPAIESSQITTINNVNNINHPISNTEIANVKLEVLTQQKSELNQSLTMLTNRHETLTQINNIINNQSHNNLSCLVQRFSQATSEFQKNSSNINYQQIILAADNLTKSCQTFSQQLISISSPDIASQNIMSNYKSTLTQIENIPSEIISGQKPIGEVSNKQIELTDRLNSDLQSSSISIANHNLLLSQLNSSLSLEATEIKIPLMEQMIKTHQTSEAAAATLKMIDAFTTSVVENLG